MVQLFPNVSDLLAKRVQAEKDVTEVDIRVIVAENAMVSPRIATSQQGPSVDLALANLLWIVATDVDVVSLVLFEVGCSSKIAWNHAYAVSSSKN